MSGARRIALVSSSYLPHLGGVEEHTRQAAAQLATLGCRVEIWTVDRGDAVPAVQRIEGITVRRLPTPLPAVELASLSRFAARAPGSALAWLNAWRCFRPDVLHVHCFGPNGVYADLLSRITRTPLVISLHGETFMDDHDAFGQSRLLRTALRAGLRRAGTVTGCTQLVLDDAIAHYELDPAKGTVVFNGVDLAEHVLPAPTLPALNLPAPDCQAPDLPAPGLPAPGSPTPARRYVLGLGRLVANKGFDLLIEAFAQLADEVPEVDLVIAGDGPAQPDLQRLIDNRGLTRRAALIGRVDRGGVAAMMADAAVFVMPSRVEPFGIVVLEAWRGGAPVIASSRGGAREFVRDGVDGLLVDPLDTAELATNLRRVLNDGERSARLATAGRQRVREFSVQAVAGRYKALYDGLFALQRQLQPAVSLVAPPANT